MLWINKRLTSHPLQPHWPRYFELRATLACFLSQRSFGNTFRGTVFRGLHFLKSRSLQRAGLHTQATRHFCKPWFQVLDSLGSHSWKPDTRERKTSRFCFIKSLYLISSEFQFQSLLILFILWCVGLARLCSCWSQWKTPTVPSRRKLSPNLIIFFWCKDQGTPKNR